MEIANLPAGKYVVAVSGGVDSVVLLDLLTRQKNLELVVAHFDHGIRPNSADDATFVAQLAERYSLPFVTERQELGPNVSEEGARKARYAFLRCAQNEEDAVAIVTAHHQDDLLETAIINLRRGTGWRGLASLRDLPQIRRPLLTTNKQEILEYAKTHNLKWREDATNTDLRYLRNRIRLQMLPNATSEFRQEILALIARQGELRGEIERLISQLQQSEFSDQLPATSRVIAEPKARSSEEVQGLGSVPSRYSTLNRTKLNLLPNTVAKELLLEIVFALTERRVEQAMLARMLWFVRTARPHKVLQISGFLELYVSKTTVVVRVK